MALKNNSANTMAWCMKYLLGLLALVEGVFLEGTIDPLEGTVKYDFKPFGGEKTIRVQSGNRIAVVLTALSIAPLETFKIFDGACEEATPVLTTQEWTKDGLYREAVGSTLFSTGEVVCIQYRAGSIPGVIHVDYRAFPKCGGKMTLQVGDIVNPTYPGPPPHTNENCEWNIDVEYGQRIHLEVKEFDMTLHHNYVMIEGVSGYDRQHPMLTLSSWMPKEYETDWWDMVIKFVAGPQSKDRGFWIHYEAIGCPKKFLPKPGNGLWSSYRDYLAFGHVMYMECMSGYKFPSGADFRHYSLTCQKDRTWTKSWEGELEDCVKV